MLTIYSFFKTRTVLSFINLTFEIGLIWAEVKQLWDEGLKAYIQDMWNILDFITNSLYIATYTLKLVAYLKVKPQVYSNSKYFTHKLLHYFYGLIKQNVSSFKVQKELADGHPNAELKRDQWDAFDPNLVSEGLFAAANIFSTLKLVYIFTVNPHLGPLQITLGRMVMDIMK